MGKKRRSKECAEEMIERMLTVNKKLTAVWVEIAPELQRAKGSDVLKVTDASIAFQKAIRGLIERAN